MEDISRELEREIVRSKPKPYKQDRKKRVIIVDDFGTMESGNYLKTLVSILSIICIVCLVAAAWYYFLDARLSKKVKSMENRLVLAEKKVNDLTREKEILMARLVIEGKEPEIEKKNTKKDNQVLAQDQEKKWVSKNKEVKPISSESETIANINKPSMVEQEKNIIHPQFNPNSESIELIEAAAKTESSSETMTTPRGIKKNIDIEKFSVTKDRTNGDLLVRFDIRNISNEPGDVSGRIFTVLKPDNNNEDQWLVEPASSLKNGIPSEYKKGQYFSITNFKPVKFIIKSQAGPDFFKKASIIIFNEQSDLIFEKHIDITEAN